MTDGYVVSCEGPEAADAIAALDAVSFDVPWTTDAIRALLEDGLTRAWIGRRDDEPVAGALVRTVAGEAEILRMAVRPDARRGGLGRALLRAVLSASADACPDGVHLEVRASNAAARALYARAGFLERGRRRNYYQAPVEDAIVMHWRPPDWPGSARLEASDG